MQNKKNIKTINKIILFKRKNESDNNSIDSEYSIRLGHEF